MKAILILGCMLAMTTAQSAMFACDFCNHSATYPNRRDRVACRQWCVMDTNESDLLTAAEAQACWDSTWNCGPTAGCDYALFYTAVKYSLEICDTEVQRLWDILSVIDVTSTPTLLEDTDMEAWRQEMIDGDNPGGACTDSAFDAWWRDNWAAIKDDQCTLG